MSVRKMGDCLECHGTNSVLRETLELYDRNLKRDSRR